jgi:hypothetical protein
MLVQCKAAISAQGFMGSSCEQSNNSHGARGLMRLVAGQPVKAGARLPEMNRTHVVLIGTHEGTREPYLVAGQPVKADSRLPEMNRTQVVLLGTHERTREPYFAALHCAPRTRPASPPTIPTCQSVGVRQPTCSKAALPKHSNSAYEPKSRTTPRLPHCPGLVASAGYLGATLDATNKEVGFMDSISCSCQRDSLNDWHVRTNNNSSSCFYHLEDRVHL